MHAQDFDSPTVRALRADLALALRAAAHHGLAEGVCNHFSIELPDSSGRFLLNPRGLMWSEVQADDIVMIDAQGQVLAGRHAVEPTAMFIHAAIHRIAGKACVLHTHMPYAIPACRKTPCAFMAGWQSTRITRAWRWTYAKANALRTPCRARTLFFWATTA